MVGILLAQNNPSPKLDSLMKKRDLVNLHLELKLLDTSSVTSKTYYYYYLGSISLFEDDNQKAVFQLLKSKAFHQKGSQDDQLLFKINDRLIESIGATSEYTVTPSELIQENCAIATKLNDGFLLYNCNYYRFTEALANKEHEKALFYLRDSYASAKSNKLTSLLGNIETNMGHTHLVMGNKDSVLPYFKRAEKRFLQEKDQFKLASLYNNFGNYYKIEQKYDSALTYLKKAYAIPLDQEKYSTKNFILKNIADTYYFQGSFEKAAIAYETFAKKTDSLDRSTHAKNIQYYNTKYQTAEKEKQILIEQEQKRKNKNIAIALAGSLLAVSIFAFLIYKNTKRKQRIAEQERELEVQKKEKILKDQELNAIDAMIAGQEKERQRLASDLHDSVGATLAAAKLQFNHLANNKEQLNSLDELFSKTGDLLDQAYTEVRSMAHLKNSGVIAKKGLLPAVEKLATNASSNNGLQIEVQDFGLTEKLESSLEISIFRIIQELITNIIKHANATEANISITQHEDAIAIIVEDNGRGFNARQIVKTGGMGLSSIEKRVEHLEGSMEVDSTPGRGTNILIDIPL